MKDRIKFSFIIMFNLFAAREKWEFLHTIRKYGKLLPHNNCTMLEAYRFRDSQWIDPGARRDFLQSCSFWKEDSLTGCLVVPDHSWREGGGHRSPTSHRRITRPSWGQCQLTTSPKLNVRRPRQGIRQQVHPNWAAAYLPKGVTRGSKAESVNAGQGSEKKRNCQDVQD